MTDKFEDPTPTTLEWLEACGGRHLISGDIQFDLADRYRICFNRHWLMSVGSGILSSPSPGRFETRGKVRRLFQAFGLELKEPEEIVNVGPLWAVKRSDGLFVGQQGGIPQDSFIAYQNRKQAAEKASGSGGKVVRIV